MYTLEGEVAVIVMDDGKANAVGHALIDEVNEGLTQSLAEAKAVVIVGRPGMFSAGFDLKEFENGPEATTALVAKGARMMLRLFSHPQPVVAVCRLSRLGLWSKQTGTARVGDCHDRSESGELDRLRGA